MARLTAHHSKVHPGIYTHGGTLALYPVPFRGGKERLGCTIFGGPMHLAVTGKECRQLQIMSWMPFHDSGSYILYSYLYSYLNHGNASI